jgi:hypothetical protein
MLASSFIDKVAAAVHIGHTVPVYKFGIRTGLPKRYEDEPEHAVFEN